MGYTAPFEVLTMFSRNILERRIASQVEAGANGQQRSSRADVLHRVPRQPPAALVELEAVDCAAAAHEQVELSIEATEDVR